MMSHEHTHGTFGRPLRIGMLTDCFLPSIGGAELVVHNLARTFTGLGHDVVVMAPRSREPFADNLPYAVSRYRPMPARLGLKTLAESAALLRCHRRHRFDIVNVHKTYAAYSAAKVRRLLGVPVVVTAHGGDIQKDTRIGYGRRIESPRWEHKIGHAVRHADALVAVSSQSVDCFRRSWPSSDTTVAASRRCWRRWPSCKSPTREKFCSTAGTYGPKENRWPPGDVARSCYRKPCCSKRPCSKT